MNETQTDMKLEVVLLGVSDVDRAKAFYAKLGWRLDIDIANGDFRGVQMTPHNSEASIIFGISSKSVRATLKSPLWAYPAMSADQATTSPLSESSKISVATFKSPHLA